MKAALLSALAILAFSAAAYCQATDSLATDGVLQDRIACASGEATVVVSRDDRLRGSAIRSRLLLEGKEIAEITRGQTLQYCITAGEQIIGVASDFFGGRGAQKRELAVDFKPDRSYAFRIFILHAQGAMIERTAL